MKFHAGFGMSLTHLLVRLLGLLVLFPLVVGLTACIFVAQVLYATIEEKVFRSVLFERVFGRPNR